MAVNKVSVINHALRRVGEDPINSIDEQSLPAQIMKDVYDDCLDAQLREWPYPFSVTTQELSTVSAETPPDYTYVFQLPADYLRMVSIMPTSNTSTLYWRWDPLYPEKNYTYAQMWKIREGKIYINVDELTIEYVKLEVDPVKWDSLFRDMFIWRLADEVAMPLTQRVDVADRCAQRYMMALQKARGIAGTETRETTDVSRNYIKARQ